MQEWMQGWMQSAPTTRGACISVGDVVAPKLTDDLAELLNGERDMLRRPPAAPTPASPDAASIAGC
jgi:hypothetical protein